MGITQGLKISDESYAPGQSGQYALSVQVSLNDFSFCVLDTVRNKYIVLHVFSFSGIVNYSALCDTLLEFTENNPVLKEKYKSVSGSIIHSAFTFIPAAVYEPEKKSDYLKFNFPLEENQDVLSDYIKPLDSYTVFSIPANLHALLKLLFPNIKIHHYSSPLLTGVLFQFKNQNTQKIIVNVQYGHFEIIVIQGGHLLFFNTFKYQTAEDFVYYLLFVCEQLELNPEVIDLTLLGEVEKHSALYSILYKYIRNIRFGSRNENFEYSYGFQDIPSHFYYGLSNQFLCE